MALRRDLLVLASNIELGLSEIFGALKGMDLGDDELAVYLMLEDAQQQIQYMCMVLYAMMNSIAERRLQINLLKDRTFARHESRIEYLDSIIHEGDQGCIDQLRMNRYTFGVLCELVRTVGQLKEDGLVTVEEQVSMFLHILAHHVKNRTIKHRFQRSGETISRYFNGVLNAVLHLHQVLLTTPDPVSDNCTDERWRWFKGCLGALDGTYIRMHVPEIDKPRYRSRKGDIATNVLGVCTRDMLFVYVLPGWEGSASDSRVLRDAVSRPNGLQVPTGKYYLVDAGYTNGEGFLAPYRGTQYHLSEWREGNAALVNHQEYFNMKHASARNVIERTFGLLKMRWAILRSPSFYPVKTQTRIIMACCLIHNLIRKEMSVDLLESVLDGLEGMETVIDEGHTIAIETSNEWTTRRDNLATEMFNEWRGMNG